MEISITLNDGRLDIQAPFKLDTAAGQQEFGNFWQQFITQQIRKILDELGDDQFSKIVQESEAVQLAALPATLQLEIKLSAETGATTQDQAQLTVKSVEVTPALDDAQFLFFLGYVDAAVKGMK
ncbi:hypothetical protein M8332_05615 [Fructilactobacillus ixorae]|uniref:Uncharacterized protein n=1 Tax=Fructilactobacillus ixorae TaxID=1750535 RepID=A0ABY5C4T8_9LACO|nr:hypothetical protein [Fructilactobacillus ixorae]USS93074.1 hypothetical protein M8332_05615 [Fructilactobacillus ixorae]